MPIEVRHGEPDMAALVALATIIGQGQQRVPEIPQITIGGIPTGGGGGRAGISHERIPWHRRAWGGPVTRRAAPTPEEQLQYEAEKMQLQERAEAEGWERKYSAKARQDLARIEKSRQDLRKNPIFSEKEKIIGDRALIMQEMGIEKDVLPPDPDKMRFAPGPNGEPRGFGDTWRDEFGNIKTRKLDGEEITQVKFSDTPEGIQQKHQQTMELELQKRQIKIEDLRRAQEIKWMSEKVPIMQEAGKTWYGGTVEASQIGERPRTEAEIEALSQRFFGPRPGQEIMGAAEQRFIGLGKQSGEFAVPRELTEATRMMHEAGTLVPKPSDAELPYYVGMAIAFLRKMESEAERGKDISGYSEARRQAAVILRQYKAGEIYDGK